ncbi:MAG: DUF433 domain-containing protein [Luteolibacter sp.]
MNIMDRITINPDMRGGQPCIRGMRITVGDVLEYFASGMTREQILNDFPYLEEEDFTACFAFAAHREQHLSLAAS